MNRLKYGLVLFTLLALLVGVFGTAIAQEKVLVIGHSEVTDSYDPAHGFTQTTGMVNHATYSQLVTFPDEDASEILPQLADSWSISDDGLTYTFTLNQDAIFSNGDDVDSDDVVFSIQRLQNVDGNPSFLSDHLVETVAHDENTVSITLDNVRPSFLSELTSYAFSITNADLVRANGGTDAMDAATTDSAEDSLNSQSAGSGAYVLDVWEPQVRTELVRNENFWGDQPYFDRVIIINMTEAATQKAALQAGEIDLALDLSPDQMPSLKDNPNIEVFSGTSNHTHFILMNMDPEIGGPFSNPTVQLAVRYALDYEGYKTLWGGVTPGTNMWVGLFSAFGEDRAFSRDLDKARELLAEAGYADGIDVTLQYPDFSLIGVNFNTNAQKIQADLAEVGINVTLEPGEVQVSLEQYRNGEQGFAYWLWGPDILDPVDFLSFLPGGKVAKERTNWFFDDVPADIQDLINAARSTSEAETRREIFTALQEYNQQSGPYAPFNVPQVQTAYKASLQGYVLHPRWGLDVAILSRAE
jgi:peptide/nickel transport system substrate-binding protein